MTVSGASPMRPMRDERCALPESPVRVSMEVVVLLPHAPLRSLRCAHAAQPTQACSTSRATTLWSRSAEVAGRVGDSAGPATPRRLTRPELYALL